VSYTLVLAHGCNQLQFDEEEREIDGQRGERKEEGLGGIWAIFSFPFLA
jgi:hypothetical protein